MAQAAGSVLSQTWVIVAALVLALLLQTVLLMDMRHAMTRVAEEVRTLGASTDMVTAMLQHPVPGSAASAGVRPDSVTAVFHPPGAAAATTGHVRRRARLLVVIICAPEEVGRRQVLRETVLRSVREQKPVVKTNATTGEPVEETLVVYRFAMGSIVPTQENPDPRLNVKPFVPKDMELLAQLASEQKEYGDLLRLTVPEGRDGLALKRLHTIVWAHEQQTLVDEYDFFLMMDSDTYVRFGRLYKRIRDALSAPIHTIRTSVYAHMGYFHMFPDPAAPGSNPDVTTVTGYMVGQAITLSPPLVARLAERRFELWTGFPYPMDDVALGHWIETVVAPAPLLHYDAVALTTIKNNQFQLDTNAANPGLSNWDTFHHVNEKTMQTMAARVGQDPLAEQIYAFD